MQAYEHLRADPCSFSVHYAGRRYTVDVGGRSWAFVVSDLDGAVETCRTGGHATPNLSVLEAPDRHFLHVSICPDVWLRVDARTDRVTFRSPDGRYTWP